MASPIIIVPDVAKLRLMRAQMVGGFPPIDGDATLHYFSNNISLGAATVLADFIEIILSGYSPLLLSGAVDLGIVMGDYDAWQWPVQYTTCTATPGFPVTAQGYYVVSAYDGSLLWCQSFSTPYTWAVVGDELAFQPAIGGGQLEP